MDDVRVSTIELFFDLVFVFTITQLTSLLTSEPNAVGIARVVIIFGNVWWMYGGYAWLTNAVPPRKPELRLLLLLGMAGFLVVALAIPDAFGDNGVAFGVGYLVVTLVHTALFLRSTEESAVRAMSRLGPYNAITAVLLVAAGFTDGAGQWALWTAAFVLHWASPLVTPVGDFPIGAAHFVERHGLILLIALGESIVAVGIGVQGEELTSGLLVTAVLGLALAAALWWLYFDGEDERAERSLRDAPDTRNPWLGLFAFGYAYLAILAGIIVLAAGVKKAVVDYADPATAEVAWFLAGGVAGYMVGLALFRIVLSTGPVATRLRDRRGRAGDGVRGVRDLTRGATRRAHSDRYCRDRGRAPRDAVAAAIDLTSVSRRLRGSPPTTGTTSWRRRGCGASGASSTRSPRCSRGSTGSSRTSRHRAAAGL